MTKGNIFWNLSNSLGILFIFICFLFSYGELPMIKNDVHTNEQKIQNMDYYIKCKKDTIIVKHTWNE